MTKLYILDKVKLALIFILPVILLGLIWSWLGPVGFIQMFIMLLASIVLYILFFIIEIFILVIL